MNASAQGTFGARWDDVRLFLALYRERSLTAAAVGVGLDASTLSRRLVALEESLDTRLFDRTREGIAPTEAAEVLLPAAEEMAAAHARFSRDASSFERVAQGIVRLSVPPGFAEWVIVPALVRLREKYPGIHIHLEISHRVVDLTRHEADLAIRTRRAESGDLVAVKLAERRWMPMIAAAQAKRRRPVKDWGELAWMGWGEDADATPPARWLAKHVPRTAIVLRATHFPTHVIGVENGLGAALLPPVFAQLVAVALVRYSKALSTSVAELPVTETWLVGHRALRMVPRVAAVWTFLVEEFTKFENSASAGDKNGARRNHAD